MREISILVITCMTMTVQNDVILKNVEDTSKKLLFVGQARP